VLINNLFPGGQSEDEEEDNARNFVARLLVGDRATVLRRLQNETKRREEEEAILANLRGQQGGAETRARARQRQEEEDHEQEENPEEEDAAEDVDVEGDNDVEGAESEVLQEPGILQIGESETLLENHPVIKFEAVRERHKIFNQYNVGFKSIASCFPIVD
jgi:hypothetical protein